MTDYDDTDYDVYEITLDELESFESINELAPNMTQYNTPNEGEARGVLESYEGTGARAQVYVHDSSNDLMIPVAINEGHNPGISVDYLLETMRGDNASLSEELRALAPRGEIGNIDFFQINVIEK